jgi:hypothetical protein
LRRNQPPHSTRLQWVVCCSGNCTKALHVVWDAIVNADQENMVCINLLLNRASPWVDIDSHLPHEGRVVLRFKRDTDASVRMPLWVDKREVTCQSSGDQQVRATWLGNYLVLSDCPTSATVTLRFPMAERTETARLAWQHDQFWQESTKPPTYWPQRPAEQYKLTFRGNTLADIQPRITAVGYQLYGSRSLKSLRAPAEVHSVERYVAPECSP